MAVYQCPHCGLGYSLDTKHYEKNGYRGVCVGCGGDMLVDRDGQVYAVESVEAVPWASTLRFWGTMVLVGLLLAVAVPIASYLLEAIPALAGPVVGVAVLLVVLVGLLRLVLFFRRAGD